MAKLEKITLTAPHTHAGVEYPPGTTLYVNAHDKAWLEKHECIDKTGAPKTAAAPATKTNGATGAADEDDAK